MFFSFIFVIQVVGWMAAIFNEKLFSGYSGF
jgi:hypothetical protein